MNSSPDKLDDQQSRHISVITVGDGLLFTELRDWLQRIIPAPGLRQFSTLSSAIEFLTATPTLPDLAVVFREWCDEHPQQLVQAFIGRMFFQRIVCCEGPLCISEARTHQYWPAACRTSLPAAPLIISQHLSQIAAGRPPLSPLAAPEDVFTTEVNTAAASPTKYSRHQRAFVLIGDTVLRETVVAILASLPVRAESGTPEVLQVLAESEAGRPDWLILDADTPQIPPRILHQLKRSGVRILALTGFPAQPLPDWASCPIHKSEILLQLAAIQTQT
ncbi:MAG: hypothetical protein RLZZ458_1147 [Planctomycetota bacterium]